jgi:hypothetical protein
MKSKIAYRTTQNFRPSPDGERPRIGVFLAMSIDLNLTRTGPTMPVGLDV